MMPRAPAFPVRFQSRHSASHHPTPCLHPVAPDPRPIRRLLPLKTSFLFCSKPCCEDIRITHPSLADTTSVSPGQTTTCPTGPATTVSPSPNHRARHDCLTGQDHEVPPVGFVFLPHYFVSILTLSHSISFKWLTRTRSQHTYIHTHTLTLPSESLRDRQPPSETEIRPFSEPTTVWTFHLCYISVQS